LICDLKQWEGKWFGDKGKGVEEESLGLVIGYWLLYNSSGNNFNWAFKKVLGLG